MINEIKPGQVVLAAALPLPLDGLTELHRLVERLYGTGDSMLNFSDPHSVRIVAPADGFGPVKRPGKRAIPLAAAGDIAHLRELTITDETIDLTLEDAQERVALFAVALRQFFTLSGGTNYVTAHLLGHDDDTAEYYVTVQKTGNPTAHDLRVVAEARVAELEQELQLLREKDVS
jgi:hypothetical protein